MTEPTYLAAPGIGRACSLWLATVGLGTFFITLFFLLTGDGTDSLVIALIAGAIAAACSLPTLLFLPTSIRWALAGHTAGARHLRLLELVTGLFGLAMLGCCLIFAVDGDAADNSVTVAQFAAPYYVAALLASYWLYRDWLRTSTYE
jgi:hypothetical protein